MNSHRRRFLQLTAAGLPCTLIAGTPFLSDLLHTERIAQPVYSITPVLFDGKWILKDPPKDQTGVWDSRDFEVSIGVRWTGRGDGHDLRAATVVPVAHEEQEIIESKIEKSPECEAIINPLSETSAQLQVFAPRIVSDQVIEAIARFRLRIYRVFHDYSRDRFPSDQKISRNMANQFLGNSPGIRCDLNSVKELAKEIPSRFAHPWDKAKSFFEWVWENIEGKPGAYTSVQRALETRVGDCEERAGVFVALCRAAKIPARLVWVPNHCWAEICLLDEANKMHWIPCHTAAYSWFGWTGAHEMVLQKGDRIDVPGQNKRLRLISDWYSSAGKKPKLEFIGGIKPIADQGADPGPGGREKNIQGKWQLTGEHPDDKIIRD